VILFVASNTVAVTDVVKKLTLEFTGDIFAVDGGGQIRSLES
jgi:hypothetical protein